MPRILKRFDKETSSLLAKLVQFRRDVPGLRVTITKRDAQIMEAARVNVQKSRAIADFTRGMRDAAFVNSAPLITLRNAYRFRVAEAEAYIVGLEAQIVARDSLISELDRKIAELTTPETDSDTRPA